MRTGKGCHLRLVELQLIFDQNKLLDLKYTMQQLLARMLHKSNPKAAAKAVDKMIEDVETCAFYLNINETSRY
jgi:hypothetical protein